MKRKPTDDNFEPNDRAFWMDDVLAEEAKDYQRPFTRWCVAGSWALIVVMGAILWWFS